MALSKVPDVKVNFTTCPICSEIFKSPKILPCLHTFCQTCIHQVVLSANHKKDSQTISAFSCPICRTVVNPRTDNKEAINIDKWAAELPDNISMDTMITFTQSNKKQECHACKRHEQTTEAKFWCKQCFEAFCEKCNSMHSWMKMLATHQVVLIDEFISQIDGIDLKAIEEQCRTHPLNMIDVFCYDHRAMCCSLCVSLDHRKCENIKSIDDITTCNDIFYGSLLEKIEHIKVVTQENLQTNHQEKETLRVGVEKTEDEASKFVDHIKRKLDNLFETFKKQLHMSRDEQNTKLNVRIRLLEQLVRNLEHWIKVSKKVKDDGSKTQLFMHVETIKHQIETSIKEITNINNGTTITAVYFVKNEKFQEVEGIDQIGSLKHVESVIGSELGNVYEACQDFGIYFPINLEDIKIKKVRTIHIPGSNLKCGVCFKDKYILLGDEGKVHLVDKSKGLVVKSFAVSEIIKRFCLDLKHERLFVSCHNTSLFYANFVGEAIKPPKKLNFSNHRKSFGALFCVEGDIYVVTNGAIKKIPSRDLSPASNLTECFQTNTNTDDTAGHNGLTIFNEQIYYTTTAKEVKCSTLEGHQIFSHKSDQIKMPVSVAMWQFGITAALILNKEPRGSLHALSVDGKKEIQLLGNFENVTDPWDMWVDIDEKEIYVAGGEYIDVYRVKFKSE